MSDRPHSYADDLTREEIEILREDLLADTAWLEGGKERVRRLCAMAFRASSGSLKNAAPQGAPMATRGVTGSSPVASTPAGAASYRVLGMYCKKHGGRGWTDTDLDQFDRIVCPGCNPSFMPPTGPNYEDKLRAVLEGLECQKVDELMTQGPAVLRLIGSTITQAAKLGAHLMPGDALFATLQPTSEEKT